MTITLTRDQQATYHGAVRDGKRQAESVLTDGQGLRDPGRAAPHLPARPRTVSFVFRIVVIWWAQLARSRASEMNRRERTDRGQPHPPTTESDFLQR